MQLEDEIKKYETFRSEHEAEIARLKQALSETAKKLNQIEGILIYLYEKQQDDG